MSKLALLGFYDTYNSIMDHDINPLKNVPDPMSRFWIMTVLAWMWSITFGLSIGSVLFMGLSMAAHVMLLLMVFFTVGIFYDAEKENHSWLLELRAKAASKN